jgi:hypothetical protein
MIPRFSDYSQAEPAAVTGRRCFGAIAQTAADIILLTAVSLSIVLANIRTLFMQPKKVLALSR